MTAVVRTAAAEHDLLSAYADHCWPKQLSDRARRDRQRIASAFLTAHPDLDAWMRRPTAQRLVELRRTGAWPLLVFMIGTGRLRLDVELAGAKNLTGLGALIEAQHVEDFTAARAAGLRLGWTAGWVDTVLGECLAVLLAWHGGSVDQLTTEVLDAFDAELGATPTVPASSRRAYRCRLASLRQLLFETGVLRGPPRRRPWARSVEQRFADVAMAGQIRSTLLRYVQTRSAVLRPRSVESLINDLLPFAEFLTAQHPDVLTLKSLQRRHIEGFLLWNRTRSWRGRKARPRPVSVAVAQAAVLSLRNLLEDIAAWGWDDAPARRLMFAADVPKLDRPLPRALTRDIDQTLMTAIRELPDPFARTGLQVLRGAGLRVGELLDLEIDAVVEHGAVGVWLRVPLGKLATERAVPLDAPTLAALDVWAASRGVHRPIPDPRTGKPTDFLFTEHGRRLGATRLRNGLAGRRHSGRAARSQRRAAHDHPAPAAAHLRHRAGQRRHVAAGSDGAARSRHPGDDDPLRHPRLADAARRLRRGDGQDAPPTHLDPGGAADRSRQSQLAPLRNAQDTRRARLPLTPREPRRLSLREHLRDLRQLHARPKVRARPGRPARRRPDLARRR